jgi:hypothetical protein
MELLLNLAWLMLALPAVWLWQESRSARLSGRFHSLHCVLVLLCALVLLFPVISATDDLHAMRPEIEESGPSKRVARLSSGDKSPSWLNGAVPLAEQSYSFSFYPSNEVHGEVLAQSAFLPEQFERGLHAGRAPPLSRVAS